jgi:hypothetical protein
MTGASPEMAAQVCCSFLPQTSTFRGENPACKCLLPVLLTSPLRSSTHLIVLEYHETQLSIRFHLYLQALRDACNDANLACERLLALAHVPRPAAKVINCDLCADEVNAASDAIAIPCGHQFCTGCLREHIKIALNEARIPLSNMPCPGSAGAVCPLTLSQQAIRGALGVDHYSRVETRAAVGAPPVSTTVPCVRAPPAGAHISLNTCQMSETVPLNLPLCPRCGFIFSTVLVRLCWTAEGLEPDTCGH